MDYIKKNNPDKNVYPAAGLYFHVYDPYVSEIDCEKAVSDFRKNNPDSELSDEELKKMAIEKERFKAYRMSVLWQKRLKL